jgi:uncharacterized protein (DUF1697 family)
VSGADLKGIFEGAGFGQVSSFRTSGNVVFATGRESEAKLRERIEAALPDALGFDVTVFVRTAAEVEAIADHEPFPAEAVEATEGRLQVIMLGGKPTAAARRKVLASATEPDLLALRGRELYWLPEAGTLTSEWSVGTADELLGTTTMRTMGTVAALRKKFF